MKPVLTGDNGDQAANISNILACEDHPGPFTVGPPEPLGLIPRWPWWGCIYVRSVPLGSADVLGSRPRKGDQVAPECARLRADFGRSGLGPESAFRALSALRRLFLAAGWPPMGRSGSVGFRVVALCHWAYHRTPRTLPPNGLSSPVSGLPTDSPQGPTRPQGQVRPQRDRKIPIASCTTRWGSLLEAPSPLPGPLAAAF